MEIMATCKETAKVTRTWTIQASKKTNNSIETIVQGDIH